MPVAGQPSGDGLVKDELGVLVARVAQRHDEEPCLPHFAGVRVSDGRTGTEIDLGGFGRGKIQA